MKNIICLLLFYLASTAKSESDSLVVEINSGLIEGLYVTSPVTNKPYYSFRGIPFAEPPLGKLRFQPPVPPKPWAQVLETKTDGSMCLQLTGGSEDCLYLNVYTPNLPNNEESELLPVMVAFYGGAFMVGTSNSSVMGPDYLIDKNIVLVTFNYRVNVFGFLNGMDKSAPGNVGLKDQLAALQWVRQNIKRFGGNPEQVTIIGLSAGSVSVQYQMQSKLSRGLFQRAIMESGSTLDHWALEQHPVDVVYKVAHLLNINNTNVTEIINELQNVPAQQLLEVSEMQELQDHKIYRMRFVPSIEYDSLNGFVTEDTYSLLEGNKIDVVPFIAGYVSNEGLMQLFDPNTNVEEIEENPHLLVPYSLNIKDDIETEESVLAEIQRQYFDNDSVPFNFSFAGYQSDEMFVRGIRKSIEFLRNNTTIYHYLFDYKSQDDGLPGVRHAGEKPYIYYMEDSEQNEEERRVTEQMTTLFTNFAKTGNPTPSTEPLLDNVKWSQVSKPEEVLQYLYIGNQLQVRNDSWIQYYQFWEHIFSTYGRPPFMVY